MRYLLLLLMLPVFAHGQEFGLSAGSNYTYFEDFIKESKPGLDLNLVYNTTITETLDWQLEVGYSMTRPADDLTYQYLRVAFIPKIYIWNGLNVQLGPRMAYLIKGEALGIDIKDHKNNAHLSALIGLGYKWNQYDFSLRYNKGISDIADNTKDNGFQATVGMFF